MGRPANKDGLTANERRACELRSEGMTQVDAYCIAFKVKPEQRKSAIEAACRIFGKTAMKARLRQLWTDKPLETIITPQEWIAQTLDLLLEAREAKNWAAVANLNRQLGQAIAALREGFGGVGIDAAERDRELIEALAGEDPKKRKAIELLMGKHEVFDTPHLVSDNTKT